MNYQSVSLSSIPGKVMNHLLLEAISVHKEDKLIRSGHGFLRGKSCLANLIDFHDETTTWMNEGRAVDIVYFNFIEAFVSHSILRKCGLHE